MTFLTDQESFWSGSFGDEYTDRNIGQGSHIIFWSTILKQLGMLDSCFEIGCNRGLNLDALKAISPSISTSGLELNTHAVSECRSKGHTVIEGSILDSDSYGLIKGKVKLSFSSGVLIHINPDQLHKAYKLLDQLSEKYVLINEYFNPVPVELEYRGCKERLFKRDFAFDFITLFPNYRLVDYGFLWRHDPVSCGDDLNWFLFEK